jgi:hypothetical protein
VRIWLKNHAMRLKRKCPDAVRARGVPDMSEYLNMRREAAAIKKARTIDHVHTPPRPFPALPPDVDDDGEGVGRERHCVKSAIVRWEDLTPHQREHVERTGAVML